MDKTIEYYNRNVEAFVSETVDVDFSQVQDLFLQMLPEKSRILDFGCGSGRDTKYFSDRGYFVEPVDGSLEICKSAAGRTGIPVRNMLFQELCEQQKYDGIWACASILHLSKLDLFDVIEKMANALKSNGVIYASFKYGFFEGERNGRYFTDFTEESFVKFIEGMKRLTIQKIWVTGDVRSERGKEQWLNIIMRKAD
ncbi:MAG: class I SAM-dependent methyltransferase [Anaerostipes sp.]|uniref:class I SAM-dependent methyltransferase n=1 Tax=Anaerostipes sp. TaxID=1872530 RepID=UPI00399120DF